MTQMNYGCSADTTPALALMYVVGCLLYTFWIGLSNVLDFVDANSYAAIAVVFFIMCVLIVANYLGKRRTFRGRKEY